MQKLRSIALLSLLMIALVVGLAAMPAGAADHRDAPMVLADGRVDINDVYAFQSPANPNRTVLIMTVNPFADVLSPTTFHPDAHYDFLIDNDGDAVEEVRFRVQFSEPNAAGEQTVQLLGPRRATGMTGEDIAIPGGGRMHAGLFDDPFFFDLVAFQNGLDFCNPGTDFFAGANVSAIVLEIPSRLLRATNVGIWARTTIDGDPTFDRMARPAINTVFIPSDQKDAFNAGLPKNDQRDFRDEVIATLLALGNDEATANALADVLLPDLLTFDTSSSAGFLNGRQVQDDVIDTELSLISGGAITTDCVDANDKPFPGVFPYLAAPHDL